MEEKQKSCLRKAHTLIFIDLNSNSLKKSTAIHLLYRIKPVARAMRYVGVNSGSGGGGRVRVGLWQGAVSSVTLSPPQGVCMQLFERYLKTSFEAEKHIAVVNISYDTFVIDWHSTKICRKLMSVNILKCKPHVHTRTRKHILAHVKPFYKNSTNYMHCHLLVCFFVLSICWLICVFGIKLSVLSVYPTPVCIRTHKNDHVRTLKIM